MSSSSAYSRSAGVRQPKNSRDGASVAPLAFCSARSCRNPRNGANPVPAPTMIIGTAGSAGGRNGMVGCRVNTKTVLPGSIDCR